jgi:hypothetical protein
MSLIRGWTLLGVTCGTETWQRSGEAAYGRVKRGLSASQLQSPVPGPWVVEQGGDDRGDVYAGDRARRYGRGCEPDPADGWIVGQAARAHDGPVQVPGPQVLLGSGLGRDVGRPHLTAASYQPADIVVFVSDVRARSDRLASEIDPDIAERVIYAVLGHGTVRGLGNDMVPRAKLVLLAGLIADARLDDTGLDEFLAAARKLADQLMS